MHSIKQLAWNINSASYSAYYSALCALSAPPALTNFGEQFQVKAENTDKIAKLCDKNTELISSKPITIYNLAVKMVIMLMMCQIICAYEICGVRTPNPCCF